jgi:hypothetical protein
MAWQELNRVCTVQTYSKSYYLLIDSLASDYVQNAMYSK